MNLNTTDTLALIAITISVIALIKSFYTDSDMEAKSKGQSISEVTYHTINQQGKKQSFFIDKKGESIAFYLYKTHLMIKNTESKFQKIIRIEDISTIKYED